MEKQARQLITHLKQNGADYADIRLYLNNETEVWGTLNGDLENQSYSQASGFGVRVLAKGAWGFASGENFQDLNSVGKMALQHAQTAARLTQRRVELMPKPVHQSEFFSPVNTDPFTISAREKIAFLKALDQQLAHDALQWRGANALFRRQEILYLDSDGAEIRKHLLLVNGSMFAMAPDADGRQQTRTHHLYYDANGTTGWDSLQHPDLFAGRARQVRDDLLSVLSAPECQPELCDLIILNNQMALQTHETIGHALELDRILGYELSYAGGSLVDLADFGTLRYGSDKLTARADGTIPNSPGSFGFDDDGVAAQNTPLIQNGLLTGAITSRQMTAEANKKAGRTLFSQSGGTCRASGYNRTPIERMTNINIDPGTDGAVDDLIRSCQNGLMVETPRSWSIGSNRENFHFACEIGWKITDGKISHVVRNPQYRGNTLAFWNSLARVGDARTWRMEVVYNCGKGQPNQIMHLGHGIPVCLFNNVQVGE